MTKNEIINEIKSVVMNNSGEVKGTHSGSLRFFIGENGELFMQYSACCNYHKDVVKNMKYLTKSQLERCLSDIKFYVEKYYNTETETVETEAKATKKDIIMGLHENDSMECDLETAEELATDGFIYIRNYEDGVLYGEVDYDAVCKDLIDEDDLDLFNEVREGEFYHSDIEQVTDWYDMGYLIEIGYSGDGLWLCKVDWDGILAALCKRWDNKLSEVA